jgi:hypothetical protein
MTEDNDIQQVGYLKIIKASLKDKTTEPEGEITENTNDEAPQE